MGIPLTLTDCSVFISILLFWYLNEQILSLAAFYYHFSNPYEPAQKKAFSQCHQRQKPGWRAPGRRPFQRWQHDYGTPSQGKSIWLHLYRSTKSKLRRSCLGDLLIFSNIWGGLFDPPERCLSFSAIFMVLLVPCCCFYYNYLSGNSLLYLCLFVLLWVTLREGLLPPQKAEYKHCK